MANEELMKNKIADAMREPSAPEALVRRNIVRAKAITAGRNAEAKLAQAGESLSKEEKEQLAAESLLGRLMLSNLPRDGISAEELTAELRGREDIRKALDQPTDVLLSDLSSGKLIRSLASKKPVRAAEKPPEKPEAVKQPPEKKAPVPESPGKTGPAL